jgi:tryptophan synthase alpha subunit
VALLAERGADGVIVGSSLVRIVEENLDSPERTAQLLRSFTRSLREATGRRG